MSKESLVAARPRQPEHPGLRLRPHGHPQRPDRPPRAGHARVPRRLRAQADGHVAALRPLLPTRRPATSPSTRPAPRSTSPRSTASRSWATRAPGSITELAIQRLLTLQGTMKPHQIISLMKFEGTDNTLAMGDHADHIHVGFRPLYGANEDTAKQVDAILKPEQWIKLIDRLDEIDNPTVAARARRSTRSRRTSAPARPTRASSTPAYFGFVQWELPGRLGPDPGRYVVRRYAGDEAQQVVVIGGLDAPPRRHGAAAPARPSRGPGAGRRDARDGDRGRRRSTARRAAEAWLARAADDDGGRARRARRAQPRAARAPDRGGRPVRGRGRGARRAGHARRLRHRRGGRRGRWTAARELPPEPARGRARGGAAAAGALRRPARRRATPRSRASCSRCARGWTSTRAATREAALQLEAALGAGAGRARGLARAGRDGGAARRAARARRRASRGGRRRARGRRSTRTAPRRGRARALGRLEAALRGARRARAPPF